MVSQTSLRILAITGLVALIAGVGITASVFGISVPPGTALLPTAGQIDAAKEGLAAHYFGPVLLLGGTALIAATVPFIELEEPTKDRLREGVDSSIDWTVKLAELI